MLQEYSNHIIIWFEVVDGARYVHIKAVGSVTAECRMRDESNEAVLGAVGEALAGRVVGGRWDWIGDRKGTPRHD